MRAGAQTGGYSQSIVEPAPRADARPKAVRGVFEPQEPAELVAFHLEGPKSVGAPFGPDFVSGEEAGMLAFHGFAMALHGNLPLWWDSRFGLS